MPVGQPCQIMGSPVVEFRVPELATFRATGPTGSAEELRERISQAEKQIEALTEGFGTRDLDQLEQLRGRADALDNAVAQAQTVLSTLLGDRQFDEIQQQRARAAKVIEELCAEHPQWADESPDAESLALRADQTRRSFVRDVEAAEARSRIKDPRRGHRELSDSGFHLSSGTLPRSAGGCVL